MLAAQQPAEEARRGQIQMMEGQGWRSASCFEIPAGRRSQRRRAEVPGVERRRPLRIQRQMGLLLRQAREDWW